jgi:hypothetical protein
LAAVLGLNLLETLLALIDTFANLLCAYCPGSAAVDGLPVQKLLVLFRGKVVRVLVFSDIAAGSLLCLVLCGLVAFLRRCLPALTAV